MEPKQENDAATRAEHYVRDYIANELPVHATQYAKQKHHFADNTQQPKVLQLQRTLDIVRWYGTRQINGAEIG
jgi:hypothetical protein